MRRAVRPVSPAIAVTILGVVASLAGQQQRFQSGVELVHLPVTVLGKAGQMVRGLKATDFAVLEAGRPQEVTVFAEGTSVRSLPLHLGLLLDTSESMEGDLSAAANAAVRFVTALDDAVDVTFVDFDTEVRLARFQPDSYPQLFSRVRQRKAGGSTALYDAVGLYLRRAMDRDGEHVLLLYTDGGDSSSSISFGTLQKMLRGGNVVVYAIGYLENQARDSRIQQQLRVTQIARDTGGEAFFPTSEDEVKTIYAKILDELQSRYTLGYVSTNTRKDGAWRKVEVHVSRPDLKGVKVRTRPGYFASGTAR